ncbi:hypothetical protein TI39_contig318g00004 [Zymoseptoria brevis]|uniref:Uncharacterized protein n=1 Tax=Zymoseptoria brevis TaxID=1047168 RepID=A0A0F4GTY3_9PEZI|nr:hypothetical protein TI39_contig318g00004 [Zymoseptoria brevis]
MSPQDGIVDINQDGAANEDDEDYDSWPMVFAGLSCSSFRLCTDASTETSGLAYPGQDET